jgi:Ca2+-binding EF-hand superfamily protein
VKYKAIINLKEHGGIKLPDIVSRINAQHLLWIKSILNEKTHNWKTLFNFSTNGKMNEIIRGNISNKIIFLNKNIQLKTFLYPSTLNKVDILSQRLRFNKHILVGKNHITKDLDGLETIFDLFDQETKSFISYETLKTKHNIDILTYNQIISAIRRDWKRILKTDKIEESIKDPYFTYKNVTTLDKWTSHTAR